MAVPAAGVVVKLIAKAAAALAMEPEKVLQLVLLALLLPLGLLAVFFAAPAVMVGSVPLALPAHVQLYVDAAEEINEEYGLSLDWQELLALDAVLLEQDFSQTTKRRAVSTAMLFVQEEVEEKEEELDDNQELPVTYKQLTLVEVMSRQNLTGTQKQQVNLYLASDLSGLKASGAGLLPGWTPNPWGRFTWPLPEGYYAVTSPFGPRVLDGVEGFHAGLDVGAPRGTPILAADEGKVTYAGWRDTAGRAVIVEHSAGYETRYYHLYRISVKVGQVVEKEEVIGLVGSTGRSTGNHLHFEIRRRGTAIDPLSFY
ncbi:MAG: M23 family metallopeptidase [Firmicutes bacterium]|nr:M23 family metallopeptidase [Bacillota bacterium]